MTTEDLAELRATCQARAAGGDRTARLTLNLMQKYDDLLQADHANSVREAIRADDAARQLAAKDDLIRDAVRLIATKDDLIRALSVRTEAQSQLLSKRAEK